MWKAKHWSIWAKNSQNMDLISQRYLTKRKIFFTEMLLPLWALKVTCILTCSSLAHHKENPEEQKKKHHDSVPRSTTQQRLIAWLVWRTDRLSGPSSVRCLDWSDLLSLLLQQSTADNAMLVGWSSQCVLLLHKMASTASAAEHCT